ncbi:MAG TPA: site-specific integrase [Desulfuromonadales bacterium]|nr:site-specific integrase [Desulfuromonadales bacterium]
MKKSLFTDTMIRKLKPEDTDYTRSEGNGFSIRVMPTGSKTWLYLYAINGKRRKMNLGSYPSVTLETARDRFEDARRMVKNGFDPVTVKEEQAEERRNALTVNKLAEDYVKLYAKPFKRSWETDQQMLNRDVIPTWGKRKAEDIKRRDVVTLLDGIVDRGSPSMANNTFAVIRKMFNWGVEKGKLKNTPCTGLKLPAPKAERDRVLSDVEIKSLWDSLARTDLNMGFETRRALKLILLTGQRPNEVAGMHTDEIDGSWWTLPSVRSKNGREHRIYLTDTALTLISEVTAETKRLREIPDDTKYVGYIFPTPIKANNQSIGETALPIAVMRNLVYPMTDKKGKQLFHKDGKPVTENRLGVDLFKPHDLRRTTATFLSKIGYMDEVIDAVLNHAKKGIIKTYNKNKYDVEKQQALESWSRKLNSIITGTESAKVIPITRKAA